MAYRGFYETAGGSGNFVPARAGLDPAIHAFGCPQEGVDARIKSGHDDSGLLNSCISTTDFAEPDSCALVPGTHVVRLSNCSTWMAGRSPAMTRKRNGSKRQNLSSSASASLGAIERHGGDDECDPDALGERRYLPQDENADGGCGCWQEREEEREARLP
jgi:hypothetical protein